ncbi:MAG: hypothetical protein HYT63_02440 [Candidatus Yanofskybacteria bacterium]|nr:hypothetical protein [Candidatus Yanofskybacteria bacterium]
MRSIQVINDLYSQGCDVWTPYSAACRRVVTQYCQQMGFIGGYGPLEVHEGKAVVACVGSLLGKYVEFSYADGCSANNPSSLNCQSRARRQCQAFDYASAVGVVSQNASSFGTICLGKNDIVKEVSTTLQSIQNVQPPNEFPKSICDFNAVANGVGCQSRVQQFCVQQGYDTGFNILEYNSGNGSAIVTCIKKSSVDLTYTSEGSMRAPRDNDAYVWPAHLGKNILGGAAFAGDVTYTDGIYNPFSYPLIIKSLKGFTNYRNPDPNAYSRDMCFYLNKGQTQQSRDNFDGELVCSYTESVDTPNTDFDGNAGALLKSGEHLYFQATPQWGSGGRGLNGEGLYAWGELDVAVLDNTKVGLNRVRFPRVDTGYSLTPNNPLTVPAGCEDGCAVRDSQGNASTNWWYSTATATHIRGISFFGGSAQVPGVQRMQGCLRLSDSNGGNISSPWCFDLQDEHFNPSTYTRAFGNIFGYLSGSQFVPLDINVPAGSKIGLTFTLSSEVSGTVDLATYVWLDDSAQSAATTNTVIVRAKGTPAVNQYPIMELRQGSTALQKWTVTGDYRDYTYTSSNNIGLTNLSVHFLNDYFDGREEDRNLIVDYISVNGRIYQSEDAYEYGYWSPTTKCTSGRFGSETIYCDKGYFEYSTAQNSFLGLNKLSQILSPVWEYLKFNSK